MAKTKKRNKKIKTNIKEPRGKSKNGVTTNKNSTHWNWKTIGDIIAIIITIITAITGIINYINKQKNKPIEVQKLKQDAINAFKQKEFDFSFDLFLKLKKELPKDSTGYYLFLQNAKNRLEYVEYDKHICDMLKKANQLHNTPETMNLLSNCK